MGSLWCKSATESHVFVHFQRLRTENRLLRQRVDLLEQESCNLADRLIQGQVTRAEVEEDTFAIKRELAAIKQVSWLVSSAIFGDNVVESENLILECRKVDICS